MTKEEKDKIIEEALSLVLHAVNSGSSNYRIAKDTNISEKTIGNYVNGHSRPSFANAKILIDYFNSFEILVGSDNIIPIKKPVFDEESEQGQPILDIRVCAGHGIGLEGEENKVIEWVNIPKFDGCYGVTVYGDSMYDKFKSGDVIFVRPIMGRNDFDFGQCYVLITNEDRYIKNIYQSDRGDEYITMTSYNTELNPDGRRKYPDRDIYIDDIKHLYKVAGKLRRDQL